MPTTWPTASGEGSKLCRFSIELYFRATPVGANLALNRCVHLQHRPIQGREFQMRISYCRFDGLCARNVAALSARYWRMVAFNSISPRISGLRFPISTVANLASSFSVREEPSGRAATDIMQWHVSAPTCVRQRTPLWLPYIWAGLGRRLSKGPGNLHTIFAPPPHCA